ncbi:copper resistance protein CopC [Microbacterium sp. NPDC006705]|uniref:copper resistance CopC family protein n=1 Tax=unclassified Microbacterium TaxID=2609290 RepID=UPI0022B00AA0|nr:MULTISPECIES: copper resistance CopC family protein [unclassified Microbacterium]MCZ4069132.1 copper resistance protein CopC [Microbacterium sp. H37-C3]WHE36223.1 copper resistance protein CopC [Microbacterium sp. BDGP8]
MKRTRTPWSRRTASPVIAGLTALLAASGLLLASAVPAAAHDNLISSTPESGSTVGISPAEVSLAFSGELLTATSAVVIEVTSPDGRNIAEGEPVVDGTTVTQALEPETSAGVFTVLWRVVSSDGHPISDQYTYTVEAATIPTSTPNPMATTEQAAGPSPTATIAGTAGSDVHTGPSGGGEFLPVVAVIGGVVVFGGALVVVLMVGRERRRRDRAAAAAAGATGNPNETGQAPERPIDT